MNGRDFGNNTKSSAVAERPRDASCLSAVSFNIPTAQILLLVTAASDLLVHKILLDSVLLSPINTKHPAVSDQYPQTNTPRSYHPLFAVRGPVWVRTTLRGSDRVRTTG